MRSLTNRYFLASIITLLTAVIGQDARAADDAVFANLTGQQIYIHRARFSNGSSSTDVGNGYSLPAETPSGWVIEHYLTMNPGGVARMSAGTYLLRTRDQLLSWANLPEQQWFAPNDVLLSGQGSNWPAFISHENRSSDLRRILNDSRFQRATYQVFQKGLFEITWPGPQRYRVSQTTQDVDFSSRERKLIDRSFQIPGDVIDLTEEIDAWGAEGFGWTIETQRIRVKGYVEGRQTRPFGPREPGYYRGRVTVRYVQPLFTGTNTPPVVNPPTTPNSIPVASMLVHRDESNGREYFYAISSGANSRLSVTRSGILLHEGVFLAASTHQGEEYFRYRVTFTSNTAPEWALQATNQQRYEIWVPADGFGRVIYSANNGQSFVDESQVPPAGLVARR